MTLQESTLQATHASVRPITNLKTLNEAYDYGSSFSRGMHIDLEGLTVVLISGTASIDEEGRTVHVGDLSETLPNCWLPKALFGKTWYGHLLSAGH